MWKNLHLAQRGQSHEVSGEKRAKDSDQPIGKPVFQLLLCLSLPLSVSVENPWDVEFSSMNKENADLVEKVGLPRHKRGWELIYGQLKKKKILPNWASSHFM